MLKKQLEFSIMSHKRQKIIFILDKLESNKEVVCQILI